MSKFWITFFVIIAPFGYAATAMAQAAAQIPAAKFQARTGYSSVADLCTNSTEQNLSMMWKIAGEDHESRLNFLEFGTDPESSIKVTENPWLLSMFPDGKSRLLAFSEHPVLKLLNLNSYEKMHDYLNDPQHLELGSITKIDPKNPRRQYVWTNISLEELKSEAKDRSNGVQNVGGLLQMEVACLQLTSGLGCVDGLRAVKTLASPTESGFDFTSLYAELLTSPAYRAGFRFAAINILERAKSRNVSGDLYTDLTSAFIQSGASSAQAVEMAWKTIALISSGGANLYRRIFAVNSGEESVPAKVALTTISTLIPLLDYESPRTGRIYSYPRGIQTTCESGKSYHFWLTAYLARELMKTGSSSTNASAAAFTAQKGYEMLSKTAGRDPHVVFSQAAISPYADTIRMDLAYSTAGAFYGTNPKFYDDHPISVDDALRTLVQSARPEHLLDERAAQSLVDRTLKGRPIAGTEYLLRWDAELAPNSAYLRLLQLR